MLLAATLALLARDNYRGRAPVWLMIPMMALWSNLHGGFIVAIAALGAYSGVVGLQDLIAGRIDYQCPNTTVALPQIESATIKPIAILTRDRSPILPDLASTHEQGLTDFEASIWYAFFLPKGTPTAIVRRSTGCGSSWSTR